MNFNTPRKGMDRQVGKLSARGVSAGPPSPPSQRGDNKSCLTSQLQGCSFTTSVRVCRGNQVFIAPVWAYLGAEPAGQGQFHAWPKGCSCCRGRGGVGEIAVVGDPADFSLEAGQRQQNMNHKLTKVNGLLPE